MSKKAKGRNFRTPKRRNTSLRPRPSHKGAGKPSSSKKEGEILNLVRTGVEKFILKKATIEDFLRTMRAVSEKEKIYSHQLTSSVFSKIVKEAIRKRDLGQSR